ncbi:MAG: tetratricopeptide repeat protein, partial [Bacteroidota bacterium]
YLAKAYQLADSLQHDYLKAQVLLEWSTFNWEAEIYEEARKAAQQALDLAKQNGDDDLLHRCRQLKGEYAYYAGKTELGLSLLENAYHYFEKNQQWGEAGLALNVLGAIYFDQNELVSAIKCIHKAREYLNQSGYEAMQNEVAANLGFVLLRLEDYDGAYTALREAIRRSDFKGDNNIKAIALNTLADYFDNRQRPDSALHYAQLGLQIGEKINCQRTITNSSLLLSDIHLQAQAFAPAASFVKRSVDIGEASGNLNFLARAQLQDAKIKQRTNQYEAAFQQAEKALSNFKKLKDETREAASYQLLGQLADELGQHKKALAYTNAYLQINEKIQAAESTRKIATVRQQFQLEQQEEQIAQLEEQNRLELANSR